MTPPSANHPCNNNIDAQQEEVIFSLTERLRQREDEIRLCEDEVHHLRQENAELENQLILRGNPIQLDKAYEEILAHLKQREEEFRVQSSKHDEQYRELERENRKLKDKVHASRKLLDEQEQSILNVEREAEEEIKMMKYQMESIMAENASLRDLENVNRKLKDKVHSTRKLLEEKEESIATIGWEAGEELKSMKHQLDTVMRDVDEKDRQIVRLQDMVSSLNIEVDQYKQNENEDKALISRLGDRIEDYRRNQDELERANDELQNRIEKQRRLIQDKDDEVLHLERISNAREDDLSDDIDRLRIRSNKIIESQRMVLNDKEDEIQLLCRQIERYDDIVE